MVSETLLLRHFLGMTLIGAGLAFIDGRLLRVRPRKLKPAQKASTRRTPATGKLQISRTMS